MMHKFLISEVVLMEIYPQMMNVAVECNQGSFLATFLQRSMSSEANQRRNFLGRDVCGLYFYYITSQISLKFYSFHALRNFIKEFKQILFWIHFSVIE